MEINLPTQILSIIGRWKLYAAIAAGVIILSGAIYLKGHSDGFSESDNKWKAAIGQAKDKVVRIDTVFITQRADTGTFIAKPIADDSYKAKVKAVIEQTRQLASIYATAADSLEQINQQLAARLELALAPKLIHLNTPALGDLIIRYFPVDSTANVFQHQPPPLKTVTVYEEKVVLIPESTWVTVGHYALGAAVGILTGYAIAHK